MGPNSPGGSQKPSHNADENNQTGTLYDRILTKIKNNKIAVAVLFTFVVLAALPRIYPPLSLIKNWAFPSKPGFEVITYIRQYDFMVGVQGQAQRLKPLRRDTSQVNSTAEDLAKEIASACRPRIGKLDATIEIQGHTLRSSRPLRAAIIVYQSPVVQAGRVTKDFGESNNLDVEPFFNGVVSSGAHEKSVDMELEPPQGGFESVPLKVFKQAQGYSFDPQKQEQKKIISFPPRKVKIIIEGFKASEQGLDKTRNSLQSELENKLANYSFLEISQLTVAELEKKRSEIQNVPPQPGKSMLSNQFSVDYVISGNLNSL